MASLISPKVPIIDFTKEDMKPGTRAWTSAAKEVCQALGQYGCFVALYDKVPPQLDASIFKACDELFDLPVEFKRKNVNDKPHHGYVGEIPIIPLHEGLGIDNVTDLEDVDKFTRLMWPNGNDRFRDIAHSYATTVAELDHLVIRMIFEHYGVERCYDSHIDSTSYLLRFLKYRVPESNEQGDGAVPRHTDKTFLSILHQNNVNGLEIKTEEEEWIGFNLPPNSYVVMAGDASMGWSNDRIRACDHRVTMRGDTTRYTLGLFTFLSGTLQVPPELVDEDHPLRYKSFDNVALVHYYATEEGRKYKVNTIKAYCGIEATQVA